MALLDVSSVIDDPFLSTDFYIIRSIQLVNDDGLVYLSKSVINAYGVIVEGDIQKFVRTPDYEVSKNTIYVVTKTPLYTVDMRGGDQYQPDLIVFNNEKYSVMKVKNYTKYGQGFNSAFCELYDVIGSQNDA